MATAGKVVRRSRKRKEKKNIERGCAHIRSSFNNTIVTITDVQKRAHLLQLRPLLKQQQRLQWSMALRLYRCMLRVRVPAARLLFVPCKRLGLRLVLLRM